MAGKMIVPMHDEVDRGMLGHFCAQTGSRRNEGRTTLPDCAASIVSPEARVNLCITPSEQAFPDDSSGTMVDLLAWTRPSEHVSACMYRTPNIRSICDKKTDEKAKSRSLSRRTVIRLSFSPNGSALHPNEHRRKDSRPPTGTPRPCSP